MSSGTIGDHCTNNPPLDENSSAQPSGEMVFLDGIETYLSKPADLPAAKLLMLFTNGAGMKSLNNQLQADQYAKTGFLVVMPDLFQGDPAPTSVTIKADVELLSLVERFKYYAAEGIKGFLIDMWLARHTFEKTMPIVLKALRAAKQTYTEQIENGVYAVGYCLGGKYVLKLAATNEIRAGALAHGTSVTIADITAIRQPVSFACVESDPFFSNDLREEGRKFLEEHNIPHEFKIYKGVPHGFAVLGSYKEEVIREAQSWAHEQMVSWLTNH